MKCPINRHNLPTFTTTSGRKIPIVVYGYELGDKIVPPTAWCNKHGWISITQEQYESVFNKTEG